MAIGFEFSLQGLSWTLESIGKYRPGGYHPVHLGDLIDGRYHVIHKLGNGGFGTVWLCRDVKRETSTIYVALKILAADDSSDTCPELAHIKLLNALAEESNDEAKRYLCLAVEAFKINGPNGCHQCFVYPVLGPKISSGALSTSTDLDRILRGICWKIVKVVDFLHRNDICHGDLTPSNILHRLVGLDGLPEAKIIDIVGQPQRCGIRKLPGGLYPKNCAPDYLVYPTTWSALDIQFISEDPSVIDFGELFIASQPPNYLGLPRPYRSPELIFDKSIGKATDLWALGCTLFETRTGRKLFSTFDNDDDDHLSAIAEVLGPFPEPWWSITWEPRRQWYENDPDSKGRVAFVTGSTDEDFDDIGNSHPSVAQGARSLSDKLAPGLWYMYMHMIRRPRPVHKEIPDREKPILEDLLKKILAYDPSDRIDATTILKHGWFQM